jgi:NAD dependent epimerase/dehydratase family enzyme
MEHEEFLKELRKALKTPISKPINEYIPPTVISATITGYMGSDKHYSVHTYNEHIIHILSEIKSEWEKNKIYKKKYETLRNSVLKLSFFKKRSVLKIFKDIL